MAEVNVDKQVITDDTKVYYRVTKNNEPEEVFHIITESGVWDRYFTVEYIIKDNYGVTLSTISKVKVKACDNFNISYGYDTSHYETPKVYLDDQIITATRIVAERDYLFIVIVDRKFFSITCDSNGGTGNIPATYQAEYLSTVDVPTVALSRQSDDTYSYQFRYWQAGSGEISGNIIVDGNINFTARYYREEKAKWHETVFNSQFNFTESDKTLYARNSDLKNVATKFYTQVDKSIGYGKVTFRGVIYPNVTGYVYFPSVSSGIGGTVASASQISNDIVGISPSVHATLTFNIITAGINAGVEASISLPDFKDNESYYTDVLDAKMTFNNATIMLTKIAQYYAKTNNNKIV